MSESVFAEPAIGAHDTASAGPRAYLRDTDNTPVMVPPFDDDGGGPARSVRFVDLEDQNRLLQAEIIGAWTEILQTASFINGKEVDRFEKSLAEYLQVRNVVGVGNGTDSLSLGLRATGVQPGDEVITAAHTYVATAEAIAAIGATPVLVDVDEVTATIDVAAVERSISDRTRAVIPVHLYGQTADMEPILDLARAHELTVMEDAAQAIGAEYRENRAGGMGTVGSFSFYPAKNLGACGDAGAVTTNDDEVAERLRQLRDHGQVSKGVHAVPGYNSRLDSLQAAALSAKLPHLDGWNERRRMVAEKYRDLLDPSVADLPTELDDRFHVYHLYVLRHDRRDWFREALSDLGIPTGTHYPTPVHLHPAFRSLGHGPGSFPNAEDWASRCVSLPMHGSMTLRDVEQVAEAVNRVGA